MKRSIYIFTFVALALQTNAQVSWKPAEVSKDTLTNQRLEYRPNTAYTVGEKLKYRVHYGFVDAGEAVLEVKESAARFGNRDAYHIVGTGRSLGAFNWFFKVRDRYESYIDKESLVPHHFIRDVNEGGYTINQNYRFTPEKRVVETEKKKTFLLPSGTQDVLSAFYYARTMDYSNAKIGDIFTITTIVDGEIYPLNIKFLGKEEIKSRTGKYRCMKFVPVIQEGRIFKDEDDMSVWVTDDANKVPVLIQSKLLIGSVKLELEEFEGLTSDMAKL